MLGSLGYMADAVPGMTNTMSVSQGQTVTANPVTNLNVSTGGGALANPQSAPYVIALGGAALVGLLGWLILR